MIARTYSTEFGKESVIIEDIYLEESMRGRGAASAFFDMIANEYPNKLHRLEAEPGNGHALDVYRRKGFEEIPYVEMVRNK